VRRLLAAVRYDEALPPAYLALVDGLAEITGGLADTLEAHGKVADCRPALERLARESSQLRPAGSMSATVVLAQVRSMVVDLLELTGLDEDQALARIPRPAG
jgi:hypothetical protein